MELYHPACKHCGQKMGCGCPRPTPGDFDRLVRKAVEELNEDIASGVQTLKDMPKDSTCH